MNTSTQAAKSPSANCRESLQLWLQSRTQQYPLALTLTFKDFYVEKTPTGHVTRVLSRATCEKALARFQLKLNRAVFGRSAADKRHASLQYLVALEGEISGKRLHAHLALGGPPPNMMPHQLQKHIEKAIQLVPAIDSRFKLEIADSGWLAYMGKEATAKNTDNILWQLCK